MLASLYVRRHSSATRWSCWSWWQSNWKQRECSTLLKYCNILKQTLKNRTSVQVYLNILVLRAKRVCEVAGLPRCRAQWGCSPGTESEGWWIWRTPSDEQSAVCKEKDNSHTEVTHCTSNYILRLYDYTVHIAIIWTLKHFIHAWFNLQINKSYFIQIYKCPLGVM